MTHTIAIVEDDTQQRMHYADALRGSGYSVAEYASTEQALAGFDRDPPQASTGSLRSDADRPPRS